MSGVPEVAGRPVLEGEYVFCIPLRPAILPVGDAARRAFAERVCRSIAELTRHGLSGVASLEGDIRVVIGTGPRPADYGLRA